MSTVLFHHHALLTPPQHKMDLSPVLFVVSTANSTEAWEDEHVSKTAACSSKGFHDPCPEPIITF